MRYAIHTLLARTAHAQRNYLRPYLKEMGLSPGQPKVLRYLSELGHSSQRELADCCDVDPSAICRMLDSLERGGFVTRSPSPNDRRSGQVELTQQGRDALDAWEGRCKVIEEQMLQGFSPEERAQLRDFWSGPTATWGGASWRRRRHEGSTYHGPVSAPLPVGFFRCHPAPAGGVRV